MYVHVYIHVHAKFVDCRILKLSSELGMYIRTSVRNQYTYMYVHFSDPWIAV